MRVVLMAAAAAACVVSAPASAGTIVQKVHYENGSGDSFPLVGAVPRGGVDLIGVAIDYKASVEYVISVEYFGDGGEDTDYAFSGVFSAMPTTYVDFSGKQVQLDLGPVQTEAYSGTIDGDRSENFGYTFKFSHVASFATDDPIFISNIYGGPGSGTSVYQFNGYDFSFESAAPSGRVEFGSYPSKTVQDITVTYTFAGEVPEPSTWALMIVGFGAVGGAMRRRVTARSLQLRPSRR